jgi:ketosteroid isomerase-like protein
MVPSFMSGDLRIALPSASLMREGRDTARAMSQENIELVLEAVDAFNRQDRDAFVALASSDVEWEDAIFWSQTARTYRGRAELRAWFDQVVEPWSESTLTSMGSRRLRMTGSSFRCSSRRGARAAAWRPQGFASVRWFADGLFTKRQVFREKDQALEAAGLRE